MYIWELHGVHLWEWLVWVGIVRVLRWHVHIRIGIERRVGLLLGIRKLLLIRILVLIRR